MDLSTTFWKQSRIRAFGPGSAGRRMVMIFTEPAAERPLILSQATNLRSHNAISQWVEGEANRKRKCCQPTERVKKKLALQQPLTGVNVGHNVIASKLVIEGCSSLTLHLRRKDESGWFTCKLKRKLVRATPELLLIITCREFSFTGLWRISLRNSSVKHFQNTDSILVNKFQRGIYTNLYL